MRKTSFLPQKTMYYVLRFHLPRTLGEKIIGKEGAGGGKNFRAKGRNR